MNDTDIQQMIKRHEGYGPNLYVDTAGVLTGGYGHAFHLGSPLPQQVWSLIFYYDYQQSVRDYEVLDLELDPVRRAVVIDMLFNLGLPRLLKFKHTLAAIRAGDWEAAARGMENSKWYGQTRTRAVELVRMMRTGKI
jgi:lysozyme